MNKFKKVFIILEIIFIISGIFYSYNEKEVSNFSNLIVLLVAEMVYLLYKQTKKWWT